LAPDTGRGRPWALPCSDRALLVVLSYRTNLTMQQLGSLFGISHAAAHRVITRLAEPLAQLLGPPPTDRRELWVVDGTLIPVHDQRRTAKSKNYRRSVNVQVVCRARDRRVVAVGDAWPGNRNDIVVFRETLAKTLPDHPRLSGDGGYRGCDGIRTPRRGPDGRIIKDRIYHRFRKRRAVAEHTIARLTRSCVSADAAATRSITPSPALPHSTTSSSTSGKRGTLRSGARSHRHYVIALSLVSGS
ncbi:transposase, partial [Streptomyces sp. NPDC056002]|uniref:transposase n=1 Tax=Streptomyces sp. NPDC056002 TaxID=3345675 RepID=UPI0035DE4A71